MSNRQNFSDRTNYNRSLHLAPRGRIVVPTGHVANAPRPQIAPTKPVLPTQNHVKVVAPKTAISRTPTARPLSQTSPKTSPIVHLDDLLNTAYVKQEIAKPVAKPLATPKPISEVAPAKPIKPAIKTIASPAATMVDPFAPLPATIANPKNAKPKKSVKPKSAKPAVKLADRIAKLTAKTAKAKVVFAKAPKLLRKNAAKKSREIAEKVVEKTATPVAPSGNFATQALAAAAEIKSPETNQNSTPVAVDNGGAVALDQTKPNFLAKVANPKLTFTVKINTARLFAVLRAVAVVLILAVSGYLAYDTWMTNRTVESTFANPAAAMSIDATNPTTADPTSVSNEAWSAYTTPADQPRYIYIPSINVRSRVMTAGVTSKGNIDTPKNLNDTAWYDGSAKPNQDGQVFIDGHTSFTANLAAAFNDLPKLQKDAQITIELGDGTKINYKVVATETVAVGSVDMGKALNTPDGATKGLTLMTCTGTFNYRTGSSDKRFIVYAVQE